MYTEVYKSIDLCYLLCYFHFKQVSMSSFCNTASIPAEQYEYKMNRKTNWG